MKWIMFFIAAFLITSCASAQEPTISPDNAVTNPPDAATEEPIHNPLEPQPDDIQFTRGSVFLEKADVVIRESFPPQVSLNISGNLPTPCHKLRVVIQPPDADNKIEAEVYSLIDPDVICTQVLSPFEESIDLGTFPTGHYTVLVNGKLVGEFDA